MPSTNLIIFDADNFDSGDIPGSSGAYFAFDNMTGDFQPKQQNLEAIVRLGTDGQRLRKTGIRGDAFPIRTILYVPTRQAAVNAIAEYIELNDGLPYEIWQKGQSWGYFNVLKIVSHEPIACASMIGTLFADPSFKHVVDFLVISTDPPAEPEP